MKKGFTPTTTSSTIQLNDGSTYKTRTTWSEPGQKLTLDIDPSPHPALDRRQQQLLDHADA